MKRINEIYVFDIDGVLTNIHTHKIENEKIIKFIVRILEKDEPVAFNTGRSTEWVKNELINNIKELISDNKLLYNLFAVGEKGGLWLEFDINGNEKLEIDKNIRIPLKLEEELKKLIKNNFTDYVYYDEDKKTMATLMKSDNISIKEFKHIQPNLDEQAGKIMKKLNLTNKFHIIPTTVDTDIENVKVGKDYAMGKILAWLARKQIKPEKFITFGDSISDLAMAKHLKEKGIQVEFIFVGESKINQNEYDFPVIISKNKFDKGTLEYLQNTSSNN